MRIFGATGAAALLSVWLLVLASCSSGGGAKTGSANFSCEGADPRALCLHSCSLGCDSTGCLRTDIAQNELLILQFSDAVDPATVNSSTIRLRTASGQEPVGEFFVNGNQVEYVPTLLTSGGATFFGFRSGEVYTLTIPGGAEAEIGLRGTGGQQFASTYTCTLAVTQGIQDLNGVAPAAILVAPTAQQLGAAPRDTVIRLEWNEMIDATPFSHGTPVEFFVRRTLVENGVRVCDFASDAQPLPGSPRLDFDPARGISVLTLRPVNGLPRAACVEIHVTGVVTDLSGKPAQPRTFRFLTEVGDPVETTVVEDFVDDGKLDRDRSGGAWSGGAATFAPIGGDARHGTFFADLGDYVGVVDGKHTYEIDTDATTIPPQNTFTGSPIAVTDGRFWFDSLLVAADTRIRFRGSQPPRISVAGRLEVLGEIDVRGQSLAYATAGTSQGQPGGKAGIFGGAGGRGGDKCSGTAPAGPAHRGRAGGDAGVLAGRAYFGSALGSGGRGSTVLPASGLNSALHYGTPGGPPCTLLYSPSACAGGGGGGARTAGGSGRVVHNNHIDPTTNTPPLLAAMGPAAAAGAAVTFFPFPASSGSTRSSIHFLVGGAGGGGAASNAALTLQIAPGWAIGCGGGGGGGAVALRAGDQLLVGSVGAIVANGGSAGALAPTVGLAQPAPGGGGSGGAIVLQSGRLADVTGLLDVRGGAGGRYDRTTACPAPSGAAVRIDGGDGGDGMVRLETPATPTTAALPNMQPAPTADNIGVLAERDDFASFRSLWYSTELALGPEFVRYTIHATVDGNAMVFSDDPSVSTLAAGVGAAIRLWIQAGQLDLSTGEVLSSKPWRTAVRSGQAQIGIGSDGLNAFRWVVVHDRSVAQEVILSRVEVTYLR